MVSLISSQVDENMITAQKRDAARQGQFYFRKTLKKCECMIKLVFFYVTYKRSKQVLSSKRVLQRIS